MKKLFSFLLTAVLLLSLCACGAAAPAEAEVPAAAPVAEGPGEDQVIDGAGRILDLPEDPGSATMASVYAVSVPFIVALDLSERAVAVNPKTKFWTKADEDLPSESIGRGVVDLEKMAALNPTALIHRSNDPDTVAAVENLGVEVVCITVEDMEDVEATLTLLGRYFGAEERAAEVIEWMRGKFDRVAEVVQTIPEDERVTALLMGGELGRIAGNDMLQTWMIEQAGGIPVADVGEDHNWFNAGVETVFKWNPEYIFCTGSTGLDYDAEDMLNDPAWSAVAAVQQENIYQMPAKIDAWDLPGLSCAIGTMYMLHTMYPDYFSAEELQAEIDDYYTFMFGATFSAEELGYSLD